MTTESEMTMADDPVDVPVFDEATVDALMARVEAEGLELLGPDGVLTELSSKLLNAALDGELTGHLGYEKGDPVGNGSGNNRNGHSAKTVLTEAGAIPVRVPRDRNGTFDPVVVPKHARRLAGFDDIVLGLIGRGLSTRDVASFIADAYDARISPAQVSAITDAVMPELQAWRTRTLDEVYPVVYMDAIVVKVRTDGRVTNRPCYIAMGINLDGEKDVLGLWLGDGGEGAKYWLSVCSELRNRGVNDILVVCVDGLNGFGDAIESVWPQATVQTCVVHLIRSSLRYVSYTDRRAVARDLKPIYNAINADAAREALAEFNDTWEDRYPAIGQLWERSWEQFIPFLEFDPAIRRILYTTNAIESLNYQLRKVTKTTGSFPTDDAVYKILYLAIGNIGHHRGGPLGANTQGWRRALNAFTIAFPRRINL